MEKDNELVLFESKALTFMKNLHDLKKEQDRLAELEKQARTGLENAMAEFGIKSFKNDYVTISFVAGSTTTTVDLKALEKAEPECYKGLLEDYPKTTTKKDSVRIVVK